MKKEKKSCARADANGKNKKYKKFVKKNKEIFVLF